LVVISVKVTEFAAVLADELQTTSVIGRLPVVKLEVAAEVDFTTVMLAGWGVIVTVGVRVRVGVAVGEPGVGVGPTEPQAKFGKFPEATKAAIMQRLSWK
jgi:hypothetical protein